MDTRTGHRDDDRLKAGTGQWQRGRRRFRATLAAFGLLTGALLAGAAPGTAQAAVPPGADFDMTVTADTDALSAEAGDSIVYEIDLTNLGTDQATQVFASIQVPEFTQVDFSASAVGWGCSPSSGPAFANCTIDVGDVLGEATVQTTLVVTVDDPLPATAEAITLFVGCGEPAVPGCGPVSTANGVFVGGSPFPETDDSNNTAVVTIPVGVSCGLGEFSTTGVEPCTAAPAGTFVATEGATRAQDCQPGFYQPAVGQSECLAAPIGTYVDVEGSSTTTPCPAGTTTSSQGSASVDACFTEATAVEIARAAIDEASDEVDETITTNFQRRAVDRIDRFLSSAGDQLEAGNSRRAFVAYRQALRHALSLKAEGRELARALTSMGKALAQDSIDAAVVTTARDQNLVNQATRLFDQGVNLDDGDFLAPAMNKYYLAFARVDRLS